MERYLAILEVSQKQAYIFASNELKNNILNSAVIAHVLSQGYIEAVLNDTDYYDEKNMVSSGGGNTILEFKSSDEARNCISKITESIYRDFDGLEVFAKIMKYDEQRGLKENLRELKKELEKKKSVRSSAFYHGSYGIEQIDSKTLDPKSADEISNEKKKLMKKSKAFCPEGFNLADKFGDLGGDKGNSNFIAVVHIDGNGMGKRVDELYDIIGNDDFESAKKKLREFSECIDDDFKSALKEMAESVGASIKNGTLKDKLNLKNDYFPIRKVIAAGDDICFVTEGRIGIECARIFIEKLASKKNKIDDKKYSACAGVAIVHQKYPFYKAYELSEMLCSNAKKFGADVSEADNGSSVSAIDWHIEFGEIKDTLGEIRKSYITNDKNTLELRPYIIDAPKEIMESDKYIARRYSSFKRVITALKSNEANYGTGKVKELRAALKAGQVATRNYLKFNCMEDIITENRPKDEKIKKEDLLKVFTGTVEKGEAFIEQPDNKKHSILFDAIELMDTYLKVEEGEG